MAKGGCGVPDGCGRRMGWMDTKVAWHGRVVSVQPRIRLTRSFDERQHSYLGYVLCLEGTVGGEPREFSVAVGRGGHAKHRFRAGDEVSGQAVPVADPKGETAEFFKASVIRVASRGPEEVPQGPPFLGVPPPLETYRERGHRRLDPRTYASGCRNCLWGCEMPVDIVVDHWKPWNRKYRREMFCYGPKDCSLYRSGATRKVPGRKGMTWKEEDWVDEEETGRRGPS